MELFTNGNTVKLRSHLDKFLVAENDQKHIRQSRKGGYTRLSVWTVETVVGKPNLIRLKSCHGTYLTASSKPLLLGMNGEKVTQTQSSDNPMDMQTHWEPEGDGVSVKLKSWCGKWMRANGGSPPWRNSVTHDEPHTSRTKNWLLWDVITVDVLDLGNMSDGCESSLSSPVSPSLSRLGFWSAPGSPVSAVKSKKSLGRFTSFGLRSMSPRWSPKLQKEKTWSFKEKETVSAMEIFQNAKAIRIRSSHNKFLGAADDEETLIQKKKGSTKNTQWTVEPVRDSNHVIRLKSCYGKYLTSINERFMLGAKGKKVIQLMPIQLDSSVEWEPVREGSKILLRTRYGSYLRANSGPPPLRKSVTHNKRHSATQESISWEIDVVEILKNPLFMEEMEFTSSPKNSRAPPLQRRKPSKSPLSASHSMAPSFVSDIYPDESPSKSDGMESTPSSKKRPPYMMHRKQSSNPFSHSDSDSEESPSKLDERTISYHFNHPLKVELKSTPSSKKTLNPPPHVKPSNSPYLKTSSSFSDISNSNFDESPSKLDERTMGYHINQPFKAGMKSTRSSKKTMHVSLHKKPLNSPHSLFDKSDSDSDEAQSKSDEQTTNYRINHPFKTEMKSTPSSKKMMHQLPRWKPSNSPHSKTPSSHSDISNSNSDESPSKSDEIGYYINHPFKTEMKKTTHLSPHRKPSHLKTSSYLFDRSDSDSDELPSKSDEKPVDNHPFKAEMKFTLSSKKTLHPPPHKKPLNPYLKSPSFLLDISDSDCDESQSKLDRQTINYHNRPPFKAEMKSAMLSKKKLHPPPHRNFSLPVSHSSTPYSFSDISETDYVESPLQPDGRTIYYRIADERHMEDKSTGGYVFSFKGTTVAELTQMLQEETCLEDVVVCTHSPLNGKLLPLRLQLPPNNETLHVVLVPSSGSF
ncbi:hypothetical protein Bca52824_014109 [Brassica carinata]|uniref:DUF569 domain-containing protein n=1 Tax=Brassica carinata TaxID=52824 RepID=A0A8X7W057_BRACI|nr:hypothetical protein Bca52824_014109 [Brassica carinata]